MSPVLEFLVTMYHYIIYILYIEDSSEVNMRAFRFLPKENFKPLFHIRRADAFLSGIF